MTLRNKSSSAHTEADIRAQARQWFIAMRDNPSRRQRAACDEWRNSDPAHETAWRDVEAIWQETDVAGRKLAEKEADELAVYLTAIDRNRYRQRVRRRAASVSATFGVLLLACLWLGNPDWTQNLTADHVAARGERSELVLPDGSRVLLDADSAINVDMAVGKRHVELLRGGAFFDVVHSSTPFIVSAGVGDIRVLGTQFDVRLLDGGGAVTLARGSVAVTTAENATPTLLSPGQKVSFTPSGVDSPDSVNIADEMAWHSGRYIFYRARLEDVVREVERYHHGRILIPVSALANERVTGSFSLADSDAALASLQASVGFRMRKVTDYLLILTP